MFIAKHRARLLVLSCLFVCLLGGLAFSGRRWASASQASPQPSTPTVSSHPQSPAARSINVQRPTRPRAESLMALDDARRLAEGAGRISDEQYEAQRARLCRMAQANGAWRNLGPQGATGGDPCGAAWKSPLGVPLDANNAKATRIAGGAVAADGRTLFSATLNADGRGVLRGGQGAWGVLPATVGDAWNFVALHRDQPETIYAARAGQPLAQSLRKSVDGGRTFAAAGQSINDEGLWLAPFAVNANDGQQLWTGGRALWRTLDGARSWQQASAPVAGSTSSWVSAIAVAPGAPDVVIVGTSEGFIARSEQALRADAATEWGYSRPRGGGVSSIVFDPNNARVVYATYSTFGGAHVWRSDDAGMSWVSIDGRGDGNGEEALPDVPFNTVAVDPRDSSRLYAGSDLGLFVSTNGGLTWAWERGAMGAEVIESLLISGGTDTQLYAFTRTSGVWSLALTQPNEPAQSCSYTLTLSERTFAATSGKGSVTVAAQGTNCNWAARSDATWLTITAGTLGTGNGKVEFDLAANTGGTRSGNLVVAGQTLRVNQLGAGGNCAVQPITAGQIINGALTANDCPTERVSFSGLYLADRYEFSGKAGERITIAYNATGFYPYIFLIGPNGQVVSSAYEFSGAARIPSNGGFFALPATGTYQIEATSYLNNGLGAYTLAFSAVPENCGNYALIASNNRFEAEGGAGSALVSALSACPWTAKSPVDWVRITSGENGGGNNFVTFTVAANTGATARTTRLEIAGQQLLIQQAGRGGSCAPRPIKLNEPVRGGVTTVDCASVNSSSSPSKRFSFTVAAGQAIAISLTNLTTSFNSNLLLRDQNGRVVAEGFNQIPNATGAGTLLVLGEAGAYTVEVFLPDFLLTVFAPALGCGAVVTPTAPQYFETNAATGSVNIATGAACDWFAVSESDWITFDAAGSATAKGKGSGKVDFRIASNTTGRSRRGSLVVNGQRIAVEQASQGGSCLAVPIRPGQTLQASVSVADCGRRYPSNLSGPTTADFFTFSGKAGDQVNIATASTGPFLYLILADAAGNKITEGVYELPQNGGYVKLPADGDYIVEVAGQLSTTTSANTYFITMTTTPAGCDYRIRPSRQRFNSQGGSGTVNVTATAGCDWAAVASSGVTIDAGATGRGDGTVAFTIGPNLTFRQRTLTIRIAAQYFTIEQAGADGVCLPMPLVAGVPVSERVSSGDCTERFSVGSFTADFPTDRYQMQLAAGEQITIAAAVTPPAALTSGLHLFVFGPTGATVANLYRRFPATGAYVVPASGVYTLWVTADATFGTTGGQIPYTVALTRIPAGCNYDAQVTAQRFEATGGASNVTIATGANCPWTARSNAAWLTLAQGAGTGAAQIDFAVAENTGAAARRATITINDERNITVEQAGKGGLCAVTETALGQTVTGALGLFDCALPGGAALGKRYSFTATAGDQLALVFNQEMYQVQLRYPDGTGPSASFRITRAPATGFYTLPATGTYLIDLTFFGGSAPVDFAMTLATIRPGCGFTLLPEPRSFAATGGAGKIDVLTNAECKWTPRSNQPWATITSTTPAGGTSGNGTVNFTLAPNATATARTAVFEIGGQTVSVEQGGAGGGCAAAPIIIGQTINGAINEADCFATYQGFTTSFNTSPVRADRYTLDFTTGQQFAIQAGATSYTAEFTVVDPSGKAIIQANERWPAGAGLGTLPATGNYLIEVRPSASSSTRTGPYAIRLIAPTAECAVSLTPTAQMFERAGGAGSVNIVTGGACAWTATTAQSWITLSAAGGTGNGKLDYTFAPNASSNTRVGTIRVGAATLTITQAGTQGSCGITPIAIGQLVTGSLSRGDCPARYVTNTGGSQTYADLFSFTGAAGDVISWEQTTASFTVVKPNGVVLTSQSQSFSSSSTTGQIQLPDSGIYLIEYAATSIRDYAFMLKAAPGNCAYVLLPSALPTLSASGGTFSVDIFTTGNCAWTAGITPPSFSSTPVTWLRAVSPVTGAGDGKVEFAFDANPTDNTRSATVIVAGRSYNVTQARQPVVRCQTLALTPDVPVNIPTAGCSPSSFTFTATGGQVATVTATRPGSQPTFTLYDPSGAEIAYASYSDRLPYTGFTRLPVTGTYRLEVRINTSVANQGITLALLAAGCDVRLAGGNGRFTSDGGKGTIQVETGSECAWAVSSAPSWVKVDAGATGKGNGAVEFTVAPNTSIFARSGSVIVSGQTFAVLQSGTGGSCAAMPITPTQAVFSSIDESDCRSNQGSSAAAELWGFTGRKGETALATFAVLAGQSSSTGVELFGPDGARLGTGSFVNQPVTLPADGEYTIRVSLSDNSSGSGFFADYRLTLFVSPANCSYRATLDKPDFESTGGTATVAVTAGADCPWIALSEVSWATITAGAPNTMGQGNGSVTVTVAPNEGTTLRSTTLVIAGQLVTLRQAGKGGSCGAQPLAANQWTSGVLDLADCRARYRTDFSYPVPADVYSFSGQMGDQLAFITTSAGVTLTLTDAAGKILGQGTGNLPSASSYLRLPATGDYRLEVAATLSSTPSLGYSILLLKAATGCDFALDAGSQRFGPAAGGGSFKLITQGECDWAARSNADWIKLTMAATGKGETTVSFTVAANTATERRTGTINIANRTFTVEQAGKDGTCIVVPIGKGQTLDGRWAQGDCLARFSASSSSYGDLYGFTGVAGERLSLTLTPEFNTSSIQLTLVGPDGAIVLQQAGTRLPAGAGFFTLPKSGAYLLEASYFSTLAYKLTLNAAAACTFAVTPATQLVPASGGAVSFAVQAGAGCDWLARSATEWITVGAADSFGSGARTAGALVAANPAQTERRGTLVIAGQAVTVVQAAASVHVSSASYKGEELARGSLVTAYGSSLATATELAAEPKTTVAGTTVKVRDSAGRLLDALITFASPTQVNYLLPEDAAVGQAIVIITAGDGQAATADVRVVDVASSLFAANADGRGLASGLILRIKPDGTRSFEPIVRYDEAQKRFVAVPIDLGLEGEQVFFIGFGTGFRFRSAVSAVAVKVGGVDAPVNFAGAQGALMGLDQLNALLPRTLIGQGEVELALTVDGKAANLVRLVIR